MSTCVAATYDGDDDELMTTSDCGMVETRRAAPKRRLHWTTPVARDDGVDELLRRSTARERSRNAGGVPQPLVVDAPQTRESLSPRRRAFFDLFMDDSEPDLTSFAAAGAAQTAMDGTALVQGDPQGFRVDCAEVAAWMCADLSRKRHRAAVERALACPCLASGVREALERLPVGERGWSTTAGGRSAHSTTDGTAAEKAQLTASFLQWWESGPYRSVRFEAGREVVRACGGDEDEAEVVWTPSAVGYDARREARAAPDVVVVVSTVPEWVHIDASRPQDVPERLIQLVFACAYVTDAALVVLYTERLNKRAVFGYRPDPQLQAEVGAAVRRWAALHRWVVSGAMTPGAFFADVVATSEHMRDVRAVLRERAARHLVPLHCAQQQQQQPW
jgi:hypothetical protein